MAKIHTPEYDELLASLISEERVQILLNLLKNHHYPTYEHSIRVGRLSIGLGCENYVSDKSQKVLGYAGLLHDIGKVCIPASILDKDSGLNDYERPIVELHPKMGLDLLINFGDEVVSYVVAAHHEMKANPYPRTGADRREEGRSSYERRKNDEADFKLAQMVAAADMYDALASSRAYKAPLAIDDIEDTMKKEFKGDKKYINQILNENFLKKF